MKDHLKGGLKVLTGYLISLLIFGIFLYMFIAITKDNFYMWLPVYSFVMFLLMFSMIYSDMHKLAVKEKKPQYGLNPYPLKGLVLGLIGFFPIILIELIYPLVVFQNEVLNNIKHKALNTFMGPLYFIIRAGRSTTQIYIIASLVVPVIAMLAYLAGYYGFEMKKLFKGAAAKQAEQSVPKFTKSPWNPTANMNQPAKKKKKRSGQGNKQGGKQDGRQGKQ